MLWGYMNLGVNPYAVGYMYTVSISSIFFFVLSDHFIIYFLVLFRLTKVNTQQEVPIFTCALVKVKV